MTSIGILAYGSLIDDPGEELGPYILPKRIEGVETPFSVEFARSSSSRSGAPTLVPVNDGEGAQVKGTILVLEPDVDIQKAKDLLWRRETRNESTNKHYRHCENPGPDKVVIKERNNLRGVETVLFTKIGANIKDPTPENLADLAICSARRECIVQRKAGENRKDGINYLISVKKQGIQTPLMPEYEEAILKKTMAGTLKEAYEKIRSGDA